MLVADVRTVATLTRLTVFVEQQSQGFLCHPIFVVQAEMFRTICSRHGPLGGAALDMG